MQTGMYIQNEYANIYFFFVKKNSPAEYFPEENSPVFINTFFIHHSLKMNLLSHKI